MKLSVHQKRVLAAILALENRHGHKWWGRCEIGCVVGAGGYHETLQLSTIAVLKKHGLICSERSSWPEEVRRLSRCACAIFNWGLTVEGRKIAESIKIRWPDGQLETLDSYACEARCCSDLDEIEQAERMQKLLDDLNEGRQR